jgi:hypothetical protein
MAREAGKGKRTIFFKGLMCKSTDLNYGGVDFNTKRGVLNKDDEGCAGPPAPLGRSWHE